MNQKSIKIVSSANNVAQGAFLVALGASKACLSDQHGFPSRTAIDKILANFDHKIDAVESRVLIEF